MKLSSSNLLNLENKYLTINGNMNVGTSTFDNININSTTEFNSVVNIDKVIYYSNPVESLSTRTTLGSITSSTQTVPKTSRYLYTTGSITTYRFCQLYQSGDYPGACVTILNRGPGSVRIFGYGGYMGSFAGAPMTYLPANDQRILKNDGSTTATSYIDLGQGDWVEFQQVPTTSYGWVITEGVF